MSLLVGYVVCSLRDVGKSERGSRNWVRGFRIMLLPWSKLRQRAGEKTKMPVTQIKNKATLQYLLREKACLHRDGGGLFLALHGHHLTLSSELGLAA